MYHLSIIMWLLSLCTWPPELTWTQINFKIMLLGWLWSAWQARIVPSFYFPTYALINQDIFFSSLIENHSSPIRRGWLRVDMFHPNGCKSSSVRNPLRHRSGFLDREITLAPLSIKWRYASIRFL